MQIGRCLIHRPDKEQTGSVYGVLESEYIHLLDGQPFSGLVYSGERFSIKEIRLLSPCLPSKIVAIGLNYVPHARELGYEIPPEPLIFLKPPSSVIGPEEDIVLPAMSSRVEFEGELAVVIGRTAKDIAREDASAYILGYTCFNDVTARDLQQKDIQFTRAKSFDTFASLGPVIETDLDPGDLELSTLLNGEVRQKANTASLIKSVPELVAFASRIMTLMPGDIIATGTPSGVGQLRKGDTISIHIDGIGTLTNRVER
ncbi:MAG: fumarylacetoacetate hydrolase family protein [Desulfurivibrionaceae bacterium]